MKEYLNQSVVSEIIIIFLNYETNLKAFPIKLNFYFFMFI